LRLSEKEIKIIKKVVAKFLNSSKIYLFGSRLDDTKKGGDIDLFIVGDMDYEKKIKIKAKLKQLLNKPIDIVYHIDFNRNIEREALKGRLL